MIDWSDSFNLLVELDKIQRFNPDRYRFVLNLMLHKDARLINVHAIDPYHFIQIVKEKIVSFEFGFTEHQFHMSVTTSDSKANGGYCQPWEAMESRGIAGMKYMYYYGLL